MRDGPYRRDGSPGRYPSRSRSRSYSRSRTRSRGPTSGWRGGSPAGGTYMSRGGPGPRGPPPGRRSPPYRQYSRSRSRSRSFSPAKSSSEEPGQIRHGPPSDRQDRRQGRQRGSDAEAAAQLQACRQQLEAEQVARAAAEGRLEFLKRKVREVAERSKLRGNMLAQVVGAVKHAVDAKQQLADAKQQLQQAEGELQQVLSAAATYLQEDLPATARPSAHGSAPASQHQQPAAEAQPLANGHDAAASTAAPPPPPAAAADAMDVHQASLAPKATTNTAPQQQQEQAEGGWVEAAPTGRQSPAIAGPLKNITFKLKL